jgi:hypothetical protein
VNALRRRLQKRRRRESDAPTAEAQRAVVEANRALRRYLRAVRSPSQKRRMRGIAMLRYVGERNAP